MPAIAHRLEFAPPMPQGTGRAFGLAVLAHLFLAGALTWGVSWKREATVATVEAELWSALPQQAAPKLVEAVPPPPPPKPIPKEETLPAKTPDIVESKTIVRTPTKVITAAAPPASSPKVDKAADARKQAEKDKIEADKRQQDQINRALASANASGPPNSQGNAAQSSGPSSGYGGLIKGRVKPNLVFSGTVSGNPQVTIEVRLAPDGTILGRPRVVQTSGNKEWDEAVARAFEKTEFLPRDNGKIHTPLEIKWRVND